MTSTTYTYYKQLATAHFAGAYSPCTIATILGAIAMASIIILPIVRLLVQFYTI